jgi:hypothetical protein
MSPTSILPRRIFTTAIASTAIVAMTGIAQASDHLDTPSVIADPRADIGDLYAWTSTDGRRLNLVMTVVGHSFSDKLAYEFHVDSGKSFGRTTATTTVTCRFATMTAADCRVGTSDRATGDASGAQGLEGSNHRFRVFAGLRDDPFFNNVRGSRAAFDVAKAALHAGTSYDSAGCAQFDAATSRNILDQWRHTDGGPGKNFLAGWTPASIVISVDLDLVAKGGKLLAVWSDTVSPARRIDRAGRPLTGNALLSPLDSDRGDTLKEAYNAATPSSSAKFAAEIEKSLGLYDGYDGICGNQLLVDRKAPPPQRYRTLATLLADDRLWVNSAATTCTQLFAVERASLAGETALARDCGGRTPNYSAVTAYRSLLANGTPTGISDGVDRDEREHSATTFPFLAAPEAAPYVAPGAAPGAASSAGPYTE